MDIGALDWSIDRMKETMDENLDRLVYSLIANLETETSWLFKTKVVVFLNKFNKYVKDHLIEQGKRISHKQWLSSLL